MFNGGSLGYVGRDFIVLYMYKGLNIYVMLVFLWYIFVIFLLLFYSADVKQYFSRNYVSAEYMRMKMKNEMK